MRKEDKIQEAYGEHWDKVKDKVSHDGWVGSLSLIPYFEVSEIDFIGSKQRLVSLRGIENNNGWTKIENESDLPNLKDEVVLFRNKDGFQTTWLGEDVVEAPKWYLRYSHWRIKHNYPEPIY